MNENIALPKEIECIVVGAGVIGLAIARELALLGREVLVLEKNRALGQESSYRNSAVLHAGIYYPANSLKAKFCKEGQRLLYAYCKENHILCKEIGKLIVVTNEAQKDQLKQLRAFADVHSPLIPVNRNELIDLEPNLSALYGLYSPSTGVVDGRALLTSFQHDVEKFGGLISCDMPFIKAAMREHKFVVSAGNKATYTIGCHYLVNAAGLWATNVARGIQNLAQTTIPNQYFAKGNYFKISGSAPFSRLVYPLPEQAGLGIHSTIDLKGVTRFGPDVEWVSEINYDVSLSREKIFYQEIRKYYPGLTQGALLPEFVGIRSKILPSEKQPQDFLIHDHRHHGIKHLVNLYGIESPGLTSSMAIARYVCQLLP